MIVKENKLFQDIIKMAFAIMLVLCGLAFIIMQDITYPIGVLLGGCVSMISFLWIVAMTNKIIDSPKAQALAITHFMFRYLLYIIVFLIGYKCGLNILSMLIGSVCVNVSIKLNTYIQGKEED